MISSRFITIVAAFSLAVPLSCASKDYAPMSREAPLVAKPQAAAATLELAGDGKKQGEAGGGEAEAPMPRKIIRNGEIYLVVKAYKPSREAIDAMVKKAGGYVADSKVDHGMGQVSSATLTVRIPAGRFDPILAALARLGVVQSESTSSQDITERYYDIKARLATSRKLESRLLELLQTKTDKVSDLLQVERELARVREKVESFEGKLRLMDNMVDLCTLTIHLSIQQRYTPPTAPSLAEDIKKVFSDSWHTLKEFGRGMLLAGVALLPWALPLGPAIYVLVRLIRRWRRRRRV